MATSRLVLTVLLPFAVGYLMAYLYRSVNAVVAPDLVRDLGLTAGGLGLLTAAYFFTYAASQLPLGVLLDRFGPRRVQASFFCVSAFGSGLFAIAPDQALLTLARALIGLGFAGGLMSSFKLIALWVPRSRVALANGCLMSFGGLGALVASAPADFAVRLVGWRVTFGVLTLLTFAVAAAIYFIVPEKPGAAAGPPSGSAAPGGLAAIFRDRLFWKLAPVVASTTGSALAIQTLWAGPWLKDVAGLDRSSVATHVMAIALGFTFGVAMSGVVTGILDRFRIHLLTVMTGGILVSLASQAILVAGIADDSIVVWSVFGMTGQIAILAFAHLSEHFGVARAGRAGTALNVLVFSTAFAAQYAIGGIIDLWPMAAAGSYQATGYRVGFGACLLLQVLSLIWYFWPTRLAAATAR
ncbi:MAG: MFS transporter [Proteobacteria bacterium]|nr:MFS transporter [Pseudomonadota bacterium]MBI3498807.1 MFS transporter [Pseudomonadota bacterium]